MKRKEKKEKNLTNLIELKMTRLMMGTSSCTCITAVLPFATPQASNDPTTAASFRT
jgi:hypothetical protein